LKTTSQLEYTCILQIVVLQRSLTPSLRIVSMTNILFQF